MSISFNGSGTFLVNSSGQPVVTGTTISSSTFNALTADLATGLSTCITKDGTQATTARIPFIFGITSTLTTDSTSVGTGSIITSGGVGITKALWVGGLANIAGAVTLQSTLQSTTYLSTSAIIYLGGTTSSDLSFRRSGTQLLVQLGDGSAFAALYAKTIQAGDSIVYLGGTTSSEVSVRRSSTTAMIRLGDDSGYANANAANLFSSTGLLYMAGTSSAELLLKRSGTSLLVRKGDDSADGGITCGDLTCTGSVNLGGASGTFAISVTAVNGVVTGGS